MQQYPSVLHIHLKKVFFLTESKSTLQTLLSYKPTDSHLRIKDIIKNLLLLSEETTTKVILQWLLRHCNIKGNETADAMAKEASKSNPIPMERTSPSNAIKHMNSTFTETWIQQ